LRGYVLNRLRVHQRATPAQGWRTHSIDQAPAGHERVIGTLHSEPE
jgi:hypothetical protein